MAAEIEEVVADTDGFNAEHFAPDAAEAAFEIGTPRYWRKWKAFPMTRCASCWPKRALKRSNRTMRILLTANASYVPPRGGATRSNLLWLENMAGSGHACRRVAAAPHRKPKIGSKVDPRETERREPPSDEVISMLTEVIGNRIGVARHRGAPS